MASEVENLYARYRSELKPLVAEYESQTEQIMLSCLVNLAQMFDSVALLETSESKEEKIKHLADASKYLDTAISDTHAAISDTKAGVIANRIQTVIKSKQTYGQDFINSLKNCTFVGPFTELENEARQSLASDEGTAFSKIGDMLDMINHSYAITLEGSTIRDSRKTTILKWGFTIIVSLLVTLLTAWLF